MLNILTAFDEAVIIGGLHAYDIILFKRAHIRILKVDISIIV